MTRDKFRIKIYKIIPETEFGDYILDELDKLFSEIYDDFESRVCKNCKWFNPKTYECKNTENYQTLGNYDDMVDFPMQVDEDFGYISFERKDNE